MTPRVLLALPFALMACVPVVVETPVPVPVADTCGASQLQYLVGDQRRVLQTMRFSQPVRIIPHRGMVTQDFQPQRLNIWLDQYDIIERVSCG
jgi:hypothetical protein